MSGRRRGRAAGMALAAVVIMLGAVSATPSPQAAAPAPAAPERVVLPNGVTLIYLHDDSSEETALQVAVRGGLAAVPAGREGLAHLVTRLALEIPDEGKARTIMGQSTRMRAGANPDFGLISVEALSSNFAEAVKVAASIIQDPLFSGLRLDNIKDTMAVQAKAEEDDASTAGRNAARAAIFGPSGYGGPRYGTAAGRKAIGRKDATAFYQARFTKAGMTFVVVSDLDRATVASVLSSAFDELKPGTPAPPGGAAPAAGGGAAEPAQAGAASRTVEIPKDALQTFVGLSWRAPAASPRGFAMSALVEDLVGKGPGSRLWGLRADEKLAYNVNAEATVMKDAGMFEAYLETAPEKAAAAEARLREMMAGLARDGVAEDELQAAKVHAKAQFLRDTETKEARARMLAVFEVLGLGEGFLAGLAKEIDALTLDDVNAFIRSTLDPEKAFLVKVGPAATAAK